MEWNVEYDKKILRIVKGDTIFKTWRVQENGVDFALTGYTVDATVRTKNKTIVKNWTSSGLTPDFIISGYLLSLYTSGFDQCGRYYTDIQYNDGADIYTICKMTIVIEDEQTEVTP